MLNFDEFLDAFDWVNVDAGMACTAYVHRVTGKVLFFGADDPDTDDELPDDIGDPSVYAAVPNKRDLDLGTPLVFSFVEAHMPGEEGAVAAIFKKRGAYGKFKDLLDRKGMLEAWYVFEATQTEAALVKWLSKNAIVFAKKTA